MSKDVLDMFCPELYGEIFEGYPIWGGTHSFFSADSTPRWEDWIGLGLTGCPDDPIQHYEDM